MSKKILVWENTNLWNAYCSMEVEIDRELNSALFTLRSQSYADFGAEFSFTMTLEELDELGAYLSDIALNEDKK